MVQINVDEIIKSCDKLQRRTLSLKGYAHGSCRFFNICMRAFDCSVPAEAVTFRVYINAPVMKEGEATIYRDGRLEMRIAEKNSPFSNFPFTNRIKSSTLES